MDVMVASATGTSRVDPASHQIAFLSNTKPNIDHVFAGTAEQLQLRGFTRFRSFAKATAGRPAPDEIIDEIARTCTIAVVGSCD